MSGLTNYPGAGRAGQRLRGKDGTPQQNTRHPGTRYDGQRHHSAGNECWLLEHLREGHRLGLAREAILALTLLLRGVAMRGLTWRGVAAARPGSTLRHHRKGPRRRYFPITPANLLLPTCQHQDSEQAARFEHGAARGGGPGRVRAKAGWGGARRGGAHRSRSRPSQANVGQRVNLLLRPSPTNTPVPKRPCMPPKATCM